MTTWVLVVQLAFGGQMSLPYQDAKTCMADAKLLDRDRTNIQWVECRPLETHAKWGK
jgi:hypothetical protein